MSYVALVYRHWFELVKELATTESNLAPFVLPVMSVRMGSRRQDQQKASRYFKCLIAVSLPLLELVVPQEGWPW